MFVYVLWLNKLFGLIRHFYDIVITFTVRIQCYIICISAQMKILVYPKREVIAYCYFSYSIWKSVSFKRWNVDISTKKWIKLFVEHSPVWRRCSYFYGNSNDKTSYNGMKSHTPNDFNELLTCKSIGAQRRADSRTSQLEIKPKPKLKWKSLSCHTVHTST